MNRAPDRVVPQRSVRRGRAAATWSLAAVLLGLGGVSTIGYGLAQQQDAPQLHQPRSAEPRTLASAAPPAAAPPVAVPPAAAPAPGPVLAPAPPIVLSIPAIGVSSPVNEVGLNPDRTLQVPQRGPLYDQAAWYRDSPTPGETGASVIIGHVDSVKDGPSVFYRLPDLRPGDRVDVSRADGTTATFQIDSIQSFAKNEFPVAIVYSHTDRPTLRLITCGGTFDHATKAYRNNIVAFAQLVGATKQT